MIFLAPQFDSVFDVKREIGFYVHAIVQETRNQILRDNPGAEILDNFSDFDEVIKFIGESETIVTNSFHGVYWATLMKRRVIGLPTASKFFSLKHSVPLAEIGDWRSALSKTFVYESGQMTREEAMRSPNEHAISLWLGMPIADMVAHANDFVLTPGANLLLCSDGLWNYADEPSALASAFADAATVCRALVGFANAAGGADNITVGL
jgi:hypothetical protein